MTHMERSETVNESFASDASDRLSRRVELAHGDLRERHRGRPSFWRATPSRALATNPDDDGFHPDQKRSLHGRQVSLVRARRCSGSTCPSEPCASSAEAAAIEGRRDRAHQRVQAVLPTLSRSSPASRSDRCADLVGPLFPRRAETVLERIPTFNLVLVAGSPAERDLLPRLIKSLFGVADIVSRRRQAILRTPTCRQDGSARDGQRGRAYERRDGRNPPSSPLVAVPVPPRLAIIQDLATQTLVPQTPRSNSRITIVTAPSTATAREYLHAHQTATADDSRAVHAVWVVLGSTEGAQVAQDDLKFGGQSRVSTTVHCVGRHILTGWFYLQSCA